jgi:aldehyde dehydrogenase (NAD+)
MEDTEFGDEMARVVERLQSTFRGGKTRSIEWRREQLGALDTMMRKEGKRVISALGEDLRRSAHEAFLSDVFAVRSEVQALRRGVSLWSAPRRVKTPVVLWPATSSVRPVPIGTVLIVGTWNYPVNLVLCPLAAALAAGNCAVVKPSEQTPAVSALLSEILPLYLDEESIAVVEGGAETVRALIDAEVDHCFFTGGSAIGRQVYARAAERLIPCTLELGGKSPVVVFSDADLEVAARRIAWGKFVNAGQSCIAPDFVLVERRIEDRLVAALGRTIGEMYGDPRNSPDYGRIINRAHVARLRRLLEDGAGRIVIGGGVDDEERYVAPTLLSRPADESGVLNEEIFGPLLPIVPFDDVNEVVERLSSLPAALVLYLFSGKQTQAMALANRVVAGAVSINTTMHHFASSELPFGGVGASGFGRYHGRFGFESFSNQQALFTKPTRPDLSFAYPPYRRWARLTRPLLGALLWRPPRLRSRRQRKAQAGTVR